MLTSTPNPSGSLLIFSGGSAANSLVDIFTSLRRTLDCPLTYIIPISDNGGSTSELIRVFGGPGIGDVRSRLVRLIPSLPKSSPGYREREAIRALFNSRLSGSSFDGGLAAKAEWWAIVEGTSPLWRDVSSAKKELIRSILNLVNLEIIKRSRPPQSTFDFTSASVGNLFLTGARLFTGSFESAIYLLGSICGVSDEDVKVIPSINSNFSHHIAAGLEDGTVIVGQNAISHPSPSEGISTAQPRAGSVVRETNGTIVTDDEVLHNQIQSPSDHVPDGREHEFDHNHDHDHDVEDEEQEDANLPGTLPPLKSKNITFTKDAHLTADLPSRISRIWYINPYGQEILPPANPRAVAAISNARAIIYSIGSLYTSLVPSLVLRGVGAAIQKHGYGHGNGTPLRERGPRGKILILNGSLDREVGPQPPAEGSGGAVFDALDFVEAVIRAGEQSRGVIWEAARHRSATNDVVERETYELQASATMTNSFMPLSIQTPPSPMTARPSRPGLFSSQSEHTVPTLCSPILASGIMPGPASSIRRPAHLFPAPLLASNAPTRAASREPSPSPTHTPSPAALRHHLQRQRSTPLPQSLSSPSPPSPLTPIVPAAIDPIYTAYVTHLLHLPNSPVTPYVDATRLRDEYGINCVEVKAEEARNEESCTRYDAEALRLAIEGVLTVR